MRGFCVPERLINWGLARANFDCDDDLFLEYLLLQQPSISHILVPTRFGLFLDMERTYRFGNKVLRKHEKHADILIRQDNIFHKCSICARELPSDEKRPYQIALRILSIFRPESEDWHYDITFSLLCRSCRFTSWPRLIVLQDEDCPRLCELMGKYGFRDHVEKPVMTVQESYAMRAEAVNARNLEVVQELVRGVCYHCGNDRVTKDDMCKTCGVFFFCPDCVEVGMNRYHSRHCSFEREPIFLTKYAYYVDSETCQVNEIPRLITETNSQLEKTWTSSDVSALESAVKDALNPAKPAKSSKKKSSRKASGTHKKEQKQ